jgi:hypothetical protein
MVHLIDRYSPHDCLAAIVTRVPNGAVWLVDLAVFNRGIDFMNGVSFEESGTIPGTWHWPERVEES